MDLTRNGITSFWLLFRRWTNFSRSGKCSNSLKSVIILSNISFWNHILKTQHMAGICNTTAGSNTKHRAMIQHMARSDKTRPVVVQDIETAIRHMVGCCTRHRGWQCIIFYTFIKELSWLSHKQFDNRSVKNRKYIYRSDVQLLSNFTVGSDVYRSFILNKNTFTTCCRTQCNWYLLSSVDTDGLVL